MDRALNPRSCADVCMGEVLIDRNHRLADGRRVRLRLPHVRDAAGAFELEVRRALRADAAVSALA